MNIYLDMDDVVADWIGYAKEFLKLRWDHEAGERIPQAEWDKLKADTRFYLNLPLKEGAHELVNYCQALVYATDGKLQFLTALPHDYSMPYAAQDKVWWADRNFPGIPVFLGPFSHDKWRHCKQAGDILIDDRHSNCSEWRSAGGLAHEYRNWPDCKVWLESIVNGNRG